MSESISREEMDPLKDIEGAGNAGMRTIWLKGFHEWPQALRKPTHAVESLTDAKSIIAASVID